MKITNLTQAATVLRDYMPVVQSHDWSFALDDMKLVMSQLGDPQEKIKIIHVAGTSGKTSTAYYIADMLHRAGKDVGLTVSPHVDTVNERVQINGQPLSEPEFCQLLDEFINLPVIQQHKPSYFGLLVAFAYWVFDQKGVEYAVVEVGLGGRLDATNVIERADKVCVITDIGLDHTGMLGHTLPKIAGEKAGIIHRGNQVFMAQQPEEVVAVVKNRAQTVDAELQVLSLDQPAPDHLPLFQRRNWSVARAVVDYVATRDGFKWDAGMAEQSAHTVIPARMEVVQFSGKTVIIDGAHNAQKILALCQSIAQKYPNQKLAAVASFSHDKDESMDIKLQALSTVVDYLIVTTFKTEQDMPRWSLDPEVITQAAQANGMQSVEVIADPKQAFQVLIDRPEPVVLVTGSFYLLNHIRPLLKFSA
jgi:dihydrofolate synthase/folylpolyglutamate synthase